MNSPVHGVAHYENFPVASWLTPAPLRPAVVAIYQFARHSDDLADEGDAPAEDRLRALAALHDALHAAQRGSVVNTPQVRALAPHVAQFGLDWACFHALLSAFEQDVTVTRYADDAALTDYCRRSANPVGQLMLQLFQQHTANNRVLSDAVCSALQRLNFLQDIAEDWRRGRLYLPAASLAEHGASVEDVARAGREGQAGAALRACIAAEAACIQRMFRQGAALPRAVGGRLGWELRAVLAGASCILHQLARQDFDPFQARPRLRWRHAPSLVVRTVRWAWLTPPSPSSAHPAP